MVWGGFHPHNIIDLVYSRGNQCDGQWKTNDHTMKPAASIAVIMKSSASIAVIVKSAASIAVIMKPAASIAVIVKSAERLVWLLL